MKLSRVWRTHPVIQYRSLKHHITIACKLTETRSISETTSCNWLQLVSRHGFMKEIDIFKNETHRLIQKMEVFFTFFIALGLAMDICAVGLSSGTAIHKDRVGVISRISILVALFHALMISIGWLFGAYISEYIGSWAEYIAALLLMLIGINMIREAKSNSNEQTLFSLYTWSGLIMLSIATSIDALAIGVSFGVLQNSIFLLVLITTPIILITTAATFWLGGKISDIIGKRAEIMGGVVLTLIGFFFLLKAL